MLFYNFLTKQALTFKVAQKVTIYRNFQTTATLNWHHTKGIAFPDVDSFVAFASNGTSFYPFFHCGMDNLTFLTLHATDNSQNYHLSNSIGQLKNLKELHLEGMITVPQRFGDLQKLEKLVLTNANQPFPKSILALKQLKKLVLIRSYTDLTNFFKLPNLDSLAIRIDGRLLGYSLPFIGELKNLKHLRLEYIRTLPKGLYQLNNLKTLYLFSPFKTLSLSKEVQYLEKLEELYLYKTNKIPETFGQLVQLKSLYIYSPHLSKLPSSFENLTQLKKLELLTFNLKRIDPIQQLSNLETLTILSNKIKQLPNNLTSLTKLNYLHLYSPKLKKLPNNFFHFPMIKTISLILPKLKEWSPIKQKLDSLSHLHIKSFSRTLPKGIDSLSALKTLRIESYAPELSFYFDKLPQLSYLHLTMPFLSKLSNKLGTAQNLDTFYLFSNHLNELPADLKFPKLRKVSFFLSKIDHFSTILLNSPDLRHLIIGYTVKDLAQYCQLTTIEQAVFRGNYLRSDLPICLYKKRLQTRISVFNGNREFARKGYLHHKGAFPSFYSGDFILPSRFYSVPLRNK